MRTLDETIQCYLKATEQNDTDADIIRINGDRPDMLGRTYESCKRCAENYRQTAEWLTDYKRLLMINSGQAKCNNCKHYSKQPYKEPCMPCMLYSKWEPIDD